MKQTRKRLVVAETILQQLGGRMFRMMTGARDFIGGENELMFRIPRIRKINKVRIELLPSDTYKVEFLHIYRRRGCGFQVRTVESFEDVYAEDLRRIFEQTTGLDTSLTSRG